MFKFDFDLDVENEPEAGPSSPPIVPPKQRSPLQPLRSERADDTEACHHVTLDELLGSLPETLSYSPLHHPSLTTPLLRRDLFDARFQLINAQVLADAPAHTSKSSEEEEYVDAKTDLIPGLYEGGLKTWEGGMDLVDVLSSIKDLRGWVQGSRVMEVGCGTALPTAFILRTLLSSASPSLSGQTTLHVQDYNLAVLQLVTLPNLLLAALPFLPPDSLRLPDEAGELESVLPDLTQSGDLHISPELSMALKALLGDGRIELKFTYGHWAGLASDLRKDGDGYDLVMTAETIYAENSVDSLIEILRAASTRSGQAIAAKEVELEDGLERLDIEDDWAKRPLIEGKEAVVLVAAKVLYFGVDGGLQDFLHRVKGGGGWSSVVKEWVKGVGRKVVRVQW